MAEKNIKISVAELGRLRILCKECRTVIELLLERLPSAPLPCPGCRKDLRRPDVDGAAKALTASLVTLKNQPDLELQFILKVPDSF